MLWLLGLLVVVVVLRLCVSFVVVRWIDGEPLEREKSDPTDCCGAVARRERGKYLVRNIVYLSVER
jgi:hypothetical protein